MLMVLNESKYFLEFYGYCGGLYLIEKVFLIVLSVYGEKWEFSEVFILFDVFELVEEILKNFGKKMLEVVFFILYVYSILNEVLIFIKFLIFSIFF